MTKPNWKPIQIRLGDLIPWGDNPKYSTKEDARRLLETEQEFGQPQTFSVSPFVDGGKVNCYDGHQRDSAWRTAYGDDFLVWAMQSDRHLTEAERKRFVLRMHNAHGQWSSDILSGWPADELTDGWFNNKTLATWKADVNWLDKFLKSEQAGGADAEPQTDRAAELLEKWGVVEGDLWLIGDHRLICGDCTDAATVATVMDGEKATCLLTDPPYNVDYKGNYIQSGKILDEGEKIWEENSFNDKIENFPEWLNNAYKVFDGFMDNGCAVYIWHPGGAEGRHFWTSWLWDDWHFQVDLVWNKKSLIISRWDYKPQHEPCMYGWKGKNRSWIGENNEPTVWDYPRQQGTAGGKREHPTEKPLPIFERCLKNHDAPIVLEPFSGSGTTLVACENLRRKCRAIEISPAYVAVALERMATAFPHLPIRRAE